MVKSGETGWIVGDEVNFFSGSFYRNLDAKGRMMLPPPFLTAIESQAEQKKCFWLTAFYGRLAAYLPAHWHSTVNQLCKIPLPSPRLANFKTKIIGLAEEYVPDKQGRIRISRPLMREAALEKEIVLVGMMDKFEIWARARFDSLPDEDVSAELQNAGIEIKL